MSKGGIKIGIKAICMGTRFCEKHEMNAIESKSTNLRCERALETILMRYAVKFVREIAAAMAPSKM